MYLSPLHLLSFLGGSSPGTDLGVKEKTEEEGPGAVRRGFRKHKRSLVGDG